MSEYQFIILMVGILILINSGTLISFGLLINYLKQVIERGAK